VKNKKPIEPNPHGVPCQVIDAKFRRCFKPAIRDVEGGRGKFPRCADHIRASREGTMEHLTNYRLKRAAQRGLVSQTEALHFAEVEMRSAMRRWSSWGGREVGDMEPVECFVCHSVRVFASFQWESSGREDYLCERHYNAEMEKASQRPDYYS
jgi:hypothetical protein